MPHIVSPHTFLCLWLLLGLLFASGFVSWFAQVPVYVSGPALVVRWRDQSSSNDAQLVVAAFLPPEHHARLSTGQMALLTFEGMAGHVRKPLLAIEPEIISPDIAQRRFELNPGAAQAITRPVAVAIIQWDGLSTNLPASTYAGSIGRVDIEIGSRRLLSFLPLIGQLIEEN